MKMCVRVCMCVSVRYLSRNEEDLVGDVSDATCSHSQADSREHVGIVALTRVKPPPIRKGHGVKWTPTGKDTPPLKHAQHKIS